MTVCFDAVLFGSVEFFVNCFPLLFEPMASLLAASNQHRSMKCGTLEAYADMGAKVLNSLDVIDPVGYIPSSKFSLT